MDRPIHVSLVANKLLDRAKSLALRGMNENDPLTYEDGCVKVSNNTSDQELELHQLDLFAYDKTFKKECS